MLAAAVVDSAAAVVAVRVVVVARAPAVPARVRRLLPHPLVRAAPLPLLVPRLAQVPVLVVRLRGPVVRAGLVVPVQPVPAVPALAQVPVPVVQVRRALAVLPRRLPSRRSS